MEFTLGFLAGIATVLYYAWTFWLCSGPSDPEA